MGYMVLFYGGGGDNMTSNQIGLIKNRGLIGVTCFVTARRVEHARTFSSIALQQTGTGNVVVLEANDLPR